MKLGSFGNAALYLIAGSLGMIAVQGWTARPVRAQLQEPYSVYIEPGTTALLTPGGQQQQIGKVIVDLRNGNVWGFPTLNPRPYPVDTTRKEPPVSRPVYLGRYELEAMNRPPSQP
ncbi:MAG: hypothetical protein FJW37_05185 [Acidobacteria bacterium]|nr:hypothetical protein [Acidobacteriota bacterium]